jgi:short-subunit dehydrogenase
MRITNHVTYSIITGASQGIGKALAQQAAATGHNLILLSLPDENLSETGREISDRYGMEVHCHETNLTEEGAIEDFFNWCRHSGFEIDMLINNAGIGLQGEFIESNREDTQTMLKLNMDVVSSMTRNALPFLRKQPQSYILNVGSIISYMSVPYKALYAATKNFVLTFSNALRYELKDTSISVSCVCPGPTLTTQKRAEQVRQLGWKANILVKTPEEVAIAALKGLKKGKRTIIPGIANKFMVGLGKYLPTTIQLMIASSIFADSEFNEDKVNSEESPVSLEVK